MIAIDIAERLILWK